MSRETVKELIDMIPEKDISIIYEVLVKFIPEDDPLPDEIDAIKEAKVDMDETIPHEAINWE